MTVARPANWRKRWDAAAEEALRARLARREPLSMIAAAMGRTNHAIRGRTASGCPAHSAHVARERAAGLAGEPSFATS